MKKWKEFEKYLHRGDWHVHTNYADGENTVSDYCRQAVKNGLELIAFTEHVRQNLDYDFDHFVSEVQLAKEEFDLVILYGCEAKVLNLQGELDAPKEILDRCEIVLGSFHSFPLNEKQSYVEALKNMLKNEFLDVWSHPTLFARNKFKLTRDEIDEIIEFCKRNNVLIERNARYNLPEKRFMNIVKRKWKFALGSDAHNISNLLKKEKYKR